MLNNNLTISNPLKNHGLNNSSCGEKEKWEEKEEKTRATLPISGENGGNISFPYSVLHRLQLELNNKIQL